MNLDDDLCVCFHVTRRKVLNYLRIERPRRAAQLADCHGAGTGCGWCRPFLEKLFLEQSANRDPDQVELPDADEYASSRAEYRQQQRDSSDS